jgi:gamma-glutamyl-gamma-aminobutyrate hydrolase PuuD
MMEQQPEKKTMGESRQYWMDAQAIERLAQHIPFESDPRTKAELIEMLRGLVLRVGERIDRAVFGDEARESLQRLGLWQRLGGSDAEAETP